MGRKRRLTEEQCKVIRESNRPAKELAFEFSVSLPTIYNVVAGRHTYAFTMGNIRGEEVQQPTA